MQVFAHRGASGEYPENTLLAMEAAIEQGADGIEFDVQQAFDALVVTHDRYLKVSENGHHHTISVANTDLKSLQRIALPRGQQVPSLHEVMQCIAGRCLVNVELKTLTNFAAFKQLLEVCISQYGFEPEQIIVSAFNHHLLPTVQSWRLGVEIGALTASHYLDFARFAIDMGATALHTDVNALTPEMVSHAHQNGLPVRVYTVDLPEDIAQLQQWGVDAIFSNYPKRAKALIAQNQA